MSDEGSHSIGTNLVTRGGSLVASAGPQVGTTYHPIRNTDGRRTPEGGPSATRSHGRQTVTNGQGDLEEEDYSLSVSELNSNSFYRSGRTDNM